MGRALCYSSFVLLELIIGAPTFVQWTGSCYSSLSWVTSPLDPEWTGPAESACLNAEDVPPPPPPDEAHSVASYANGGLFTPPTPPAIPTDQGCLPGRPSGHNHGDNNVASILPEPSGAPQTIPRLYPAGWSHTHGDNNEAPIPPEPSGGPQPAGHNHGDNNEASTLQNGGWHSWNQACYSQDNSWNEAGYWQDNSWNQACYLQYNFHGNSWNRAGYLQGHSHDNSWNQAGYSQYNFLDNQAGSYQDKSDQLDCGGDARAERERTPRRPD